MRLFLSLALLSISARVSGNSAAHNFMSTIRALLPQAAPPAPTKSDVQAEHYSVIIDAGSTGSRVHVYRTIYEPQNNFPVVHPVSKVMKNHAALAAFSAQPNLAGASLLPLIDHAHSQASLRGGHLMTLRTIKRE